MAKIKLRNKQQQARQRQQQRQRQRQQRQKSERKSRFESTLEEGSLLTFSLTVRHLGNCTILTIPKPVVLAMELEPGQEVKLTYDTDDNGHFKVEQES